MGHQKSNIRAIKKEQRETAKALAKEQEKLQKALDKAAAKLAKEEEKKRIKEEAKVTRDALKAAKHLEKIMPVTTAILKMMAVDIGRTEDLPEGIQPVVDDTIFIGGEACTSTSQETAEKTPIMLLASLPPAQPSSLSNPSTPAQKTPQQELTILMEEPEQPSPKQESEFVTPFKIPMES
jgi:hypothetical protein